jgi:hypothetical protein
MEQPMSDSTSTVKTPIHLWIVAGLAVLWNAIGAFDYLMTQTRNEGYMGQFTSEQLEYFYGFPMWVEAAWAIAVWGGLVGAVLLLLRKCLAIPVFVASLVAMVATTIHNYGLSDGMEVVGDTGSLVFTGVIFLISVGLVLYAQAMQKRGVLV